MPKQKINVFEACDRANKMLLQAGFKLQHQSRKTEARYYNLPGREEVLRLAAHRYHGPLFGLPKVCAKVTFYPGCDIPNHIAISDERLETTVATAIGFYMMKSTSGS